MNILIIRTSAMGDIVHALPTLTALRRHAPEAKIAWVVEAVFAPLLEGHRDIDHRFIVRTRTWRNGPLSRAVRQEIADCRQQLRAFRPDIALDLMGNHKGALLARISGAPRRIGAARTDRREPSSALWINEPVAVEGRHAVDRTRSLLAPLGVAPAAEGSADFAGDRILPEAHSDTEQAPYAVIQAGAGWGNKQYPTDWWGAVASALRQRAGLRTLVPIAPGEGHLARAIADASEGAAHTVDAGPFATLARVLRGARVVLGGDTGPLHLAQALGRPIVCLMGPTDPYRNGPYADPEAAIWHQLPCSFCYKRFAEVKACLLNIAPDVVVDRALRTLDESRRPDDHGQHLDSATVAARAPIAERDSRSHDPTPRSARSSSHDRGWNRQANANDATSSIRGRKHA